MVMPEVFVYHISVTFIPAEAPPHTATGTVNEACTYISFPQKASGFFITCTAEEDDE